MNKSASARHWQKIGYAEQRIEEAAGAGIQFKLDHLTIHARMLEAIPAKLPVWADMYLRGYITSTMRRFERMIEFRYQGPDGNWVNAKDLTYEPGSVGEWITGQKNPMCGHFWIDSDRPYSGHGVTATKVAARLNGWKEIES